jgi:hypothetical protein
MFIEIRVGGDLANTIVFAQLVWKYYVYACVFFVRLRMQDDGMAGLGSSQKKRLLWWRDTRLCYTILYLTIEFSFSNSYE